MKKYFSIITLAFIILSGLSFVLQDYRVDENQFVIHISDPKDGKLKFYWKDENKQIYGSLKNLKNSLESKNEKLIFAMNGGMYLKDQSPQGLYVEEGTLIKEMDDKESGYGNFYLQPNGIFYLTTDQKAEVIPTSDFKIDSTIYYATQSGPMLLMDGEYHPKLTKGSSNLHSRNGVGILPNGKILFAMSKEKVNFYDLATLFKQNGCLNALYLDGFVSRTYSASSDWKQLDGNFGVIIGEIE